MALMDRSKSGAVTLKDVAVRCNVSVMTVSRALRGIPTVSEETTNRILAVATEMGYDPSYHLAARRMVLRQHGKDIINQVAGLFFPPGFHNITYFAKIFFGILDVTTQKNYGLLTTYILDNPEASLLPVFLRGDVDGAIVSAHPHVFTPLYERLRAEPHFASRPIVYLFTPMPGVSAVLQDEFGGAYAATAHLLDLGHRYIQQFTTLSENYYPRVERLAGARKAYVDRGLDPNTYLRLGVQKHFDDSVLQALNQSPRITAIMAGNDPYAVRARELVEQQGLRVPQDISIVGFDDVEPMPDHRGKNMLTAVRVPLVELGQQAAELLLRRIKGDLPQDENIVLPTTLIVRGSTAPPKRSNR